MLWNFGFGLVEKAKLRLAGRGTLSPSHWPPGGEGRNEGSRSEAGEAGGAVAPPIAARLGRERGRPLAREEAEGGGGAGGGRGPAGETEAPPPAGAARTHAGHAGSGGVCALREGRSPGAGGGWGKPGGARQASGVGRAAPGRGWAGHGGGAGGGRAPPRPHPPGGGGGGHTSAERWRRLSPALGGGGRLVPPVLLLPACRRRRGAHGGAARGSAGLQRGLLQGERGLPWRPGGRGRRVALGTARRGAACGPRLGGGGWLGRGRLGRGGAAALWRACLAGAQVGPRGE